MKTVAMVVLAVFIPGLLYMAIRKESFWPQIPASESIKVSEPISVSEPIPPREKNPAETLATTDETKSAPSWALQWMNFPRDEQKIWKILSIVIPSLVSILLYLIDYRLRRSWHVGNKTWLKTWVENDERFKSELIAAVNFMKEVEDKDRSEFQDKRDSMMNIMKVEDERRAQFQNEMDSMKRMIMKIINERRAEFRNGMRLMDKKMKVDKECRAQFQNEIGSIKRMMKIDKDRRTNLLNGMSSMRKMIIEENERRAEFKDEMCSMMKVEEERRARLLNEMCSMKKMMEEKAECRAQLQKDQDRSVGLSE
jgi:hypothetical protein